MSKKKYTGELTLDAVLKAIASTMNTKANSSDITAAINNLDYTYIGAGNYVMEVSQSNGKISVIKGTLPTSLKNPKALSIGGVSYDGSAAKTIAVDGTYNSSTNKIATQTTVTNALSSFSTCPFSAGTSEPSNTNLLWIDTNTSTGGLKYYNGSKWVHVPVAYT